MRNTSLSSLRAYIMRWSPVSALLVHVAGTLRSSTWSSGDEDPLQPSARTTTATKQCPGFIAQAHLFTSCSCQYTHIRAMSGAGATRVRQRRFGVFGAP